MDNEQASWEMQQACEERELAAIEALKRCAKAGARLDDLQMLARECGIDPKFITIGGERAKN